MASSWNSASSQTKLMYVTLEILPTRLSRRSQMLPPDPWSVWIRPSGIVNRVFSPKPDGIRRAAVVEVVLRGRGRGRGIDDCFHPAGLLLRQCSSL